MNRSRATVWARTPAQRSHWADLVLDHLAFARVGLTAQTYVALVASRARAVAVLQFLRDTGLAEERLARLKYPAGLDIGASSPEEIALSILAEIVRRRPRRPLI